MTTLVVRGLFLAPFLIALSAFSDQGPMFVFWNGVALVAAGLLLSALGRDMRRSLWVWTILFVFIAGYYIKSLWVLAHVEDPSYMVVYYTELLWLTPEFIVDSYQWITLPFVGFCALGWALMRWNIPRGGVDVDRARVVSQWVMTLLLITVFLGLLSEGMKLVFGFGLMGQEVNRLPLRLDTVFIRLRSNVVPAVTLLCLWLLDRPAQSHRWLFGFSLIMLLGGVSALVTTSRGAFVIAILPIVFLWLLTDKFTAQRRGLFFATLLLTIAVFPLISALRYVRLGADDDLLESVQLATTVADDIDRGNLWMESAIAVATRVSGVDGLWHVLNFDPEERDLAWVGNLLLVEQMVPYFTRVVVGVETPGDFRTPGLVGAAYLLASGPGAVTLTMLYVLIVYAFWRHIAQLRTAPVAMALTASALVIFTSEGLTNWQDLLALLFAIYLCEYLAGILVREQPSSLAARTSPPPATPVGGFRHAE